MRYLVALLVLLAGCATVQQVDILPRGGGARGTGTFDHIHQVLTAEVDGKRYQGRPVQETSTSSFSLFGPQRTTTTNKETALLIGDTGQIRCEFAWDQMKTHANGVCVDSKNVTYDLLIRNS